MKVIIILFAFILFQISSTARPQYSMLTGNRCLSCHVNVQGGGPRNILGSYSRSDIGFFGMKNTAIGEFFKNLAKFNSFADEKIIIGLDFRMQSAKLGGPEKSKRENFIMQASPYLVIKPHEWFTFNGHYNFTERIYPNQSRWSAGLIIKPTFDLPQLKIGMIKPSIGNQYDDHTLLIRQIAGRSGSFPILPPDFTELGAEISYDALKYLNLSFGAFNSKNLSQNTVIDSKGNQIPIVKDNSISYLGRIAFLPRFLGNMINTNIGASIYYNPDFNILNMFAQIGWTDKFSILTEYILTEKNDIRNTQNFMAEFLYQLTAPITLSIRYETASTDDMVIYDKTIKFETSQYVFGVNLYPVPYLEFRPEYRIYDRDFSGSFATQWALQIHLYY